MSQHALELLQNGLALHEAGRLNEAATHYKQVLDIVPDHPETLDLMGVLLHQSGRNTESAELLRRAVKAQPLSPVFHNHLGACLLALDEYEEAVKSFSAALKAQPKMPEAALNLAQALIKAGRHQEAEEPARVAFEKAPGSPDTGLVLSMVLRYSARSEDAILVLDRSSSLSPLDSRLYLERAQVFADLDHAHQAERASLRALVLQPATTEAYIRVDNVHRPGNSARRALCVAPLDDRLWGSLASRLNDAWQNELGVYAAVRAILIAPEKLPGHINLLSCAMRISRYMLSRNAGLRALMIDDSLDSVAIVTSESAFATGDTALGWSLYERRAGLPDVLPRHGLPPAWGRCDPPGGPLLVCAEQGVGDEFIFLSCLPDLLRAVPDVIVECDARNVALFQRSFSAAQFAPRTITEIEQGYYAWDYHHLVANTGPVAHILSGSLPGMFGAGLGRPALERGYLVPGPDEATRWQNWLDERGNGLKIGLCWRSGLVTPHRSEFYFSPELILRAIAPASEVLVSLMYVDAAQEIDQVYRRMGLIIHDPPGISQRDELDRLAALIACLDIVVTVDTSVCAMAAASGIPTVRLEASYMTLVSGRDAFFANVFPCRDIDRPFDRNEALRRAALKYREWADQIEFRQ